jgi:hypothetical protein
MDVEAILGVADCVDQMARRVQGQLGRFVIHGNLKAGTAVVG